jgi:tellurite resistance protein TerC
VFALMGLRQLYFLLGDLLKRLVYLSLGLSVVLAFIGVKLVLHAMHENELPFINGGHHIEWAPEIPIWVSLGFIIVTLGITTIASLRKSRTLPADPPDPAAETEDPADGTPEPELDPKTKAELDALREPEPHESDSKKS